MKNVDHPPTQKEGQYRKMGLIPPEIDAIKQEQAHRLFSNILNCSDYESKIMSALMAANRPLITREVTIHSGLPRTKTYGNIKQLLETGFIQLVMVTMEAFLGQLPRIWEWWPESKQRIWKLQNLIDVKTYTPNYPYIEEIIHTRLEQLNLSRHELEDLRDKLMN